MQWELKLPTGCREAEREGRMVRRLLPPFSPAPQGLKMPQKPEDKGAWKLVS